jgi:hypothetical protein
MSIFFFEAIEQYENVLIDGVVIYIK